MARRARNQIFGVLRGVQVNCAYEIHVPVFENDQFALLDDLIHVAVVGPSEDDIGRIAFNRRIIKALVVVPGRECASRSGLDTSRSARAFSFVLPVRTLTFTFVLTLA